MVSLPETEIHKWFFGSLRSPHYYVFEAVYLQVLRNKMCSSKHISTHRDTHIWQIKYIFLSLENNLNLLYMDGIIGIEYHLLTSYKRC